MDTEELRSALSAFISAELGSAARVVNLEESDGHAGLTFLFDVADAQGASTGYVIKLPPKGVRRHGNTDVYRQAPLMRALHKAGVPVPQVPWAYDDNPWFEVPFIVMERLPGRVFAQYALPGMQPAERSRAVVVNQLASGEFNSFDVENGGRRPLSQYCGLRPIVAKVDAAYQEKAFVPVKIDNRARPEQGREQAQDRGRDHGACRRAEAPAAYPSAHLRL